MEKVAENIDTLEQHGIHVDHLTSEMKSKIEALSDDEVQMMVSLTNRFNGKLSKEPTMLWGSKHY